MYCKNCNSSNIFKKKFNFDFYSHRDFSKIISSNTYLECRDCKIIYSMKTLFLKRLYKKIFAKKKLVTKSKDIELIPKFNDVNIYQHFFNKEIKNKNNLRILDYGNSSINQLKDYSNFFYNTKIFFYDIAISKDYLFYNKKTNTKCIITSNLKKIDQKIDIMISFNSLQYYLNYKSFFKFIKRKSYLKTKMYITTPSIDINKYFFLLGDEYLKFSKIGLINFLEKNLNKETKLLKRNYLSTVNFALVNFNKNKKLRKAKKVNKLDAIHKYLNQKSLQIKNLNLKKTFIFGTRVNSYFIAKYLSNFGGLIDDQINKTVKKYRLLDKIYDKDILIMIPYMGIKYNMIKKILIKKKFKNFFQI